MLFMNKPIKSLIAFASILAIYSSIFIQIPSVSVSANEITPTEANAVIEVQEDSYKEVFSYMDILNVYYKDIVNYCEEMKVEIDETLTLSSFSDAYYEQDTYLISDYIDYLKTVIDTKSQNNLSLSISDITFNSEVMLLSSVTEKDWWEDIGRGEKLPQQPNYDNWSYRFINQNSKTVPPVYIEHNGTATHITACYYIAIDGIRYKVVSAVNNLDYKNNKGSLTMHYNLIMVG